MSQNSIYSDYATKIMDDTDNNPDLGVDISMPLLAVMKKDLDPALKRAVPSHLTYFSILIWRATKRSGETSSGAYLTMPKHLFFSF